ncbi:hypothetical protein C8J57DRAFT_1542613 [Mycena rebaudengoi]|nr:hypothetical protein C8J57DRAFT_1542613 [Mycena rebaudengoi]
MKNYGVDAEDVGSYEDLSTVCALRLLHCDKHAEYPHAPQAKVNALKANQSAKTFSVRTAALRLRQDHHVVIKGRPARIIDLSISKYACHWGAKYISSYLTSSPIKNGSEDISRVKDFINAPILVGAEYTFLNIDVNLLTDDGLPKDDVNIPHSKLGASLFSDFAEGKDLRMRTLSALGEEQISPVVAYEEAGD